MALPSSNTHQPTQGRPSKRPSLLAWRRKKPFIIHSRKVYLPLWSKRGLLISVRNFRHSPTQRSKYHRQLTIPVYGLEIREIAIRSAGRREARKSINRRRSAAAVLPPPKRLKWRYIFACLFIISGLTGSWHYAYQLRKPSSVTLHTVQNPKAPAHLPAASPGSTVVGPSLSASTPTHLYIPSVHIDTDLAAVGLNTDGTLQVPSNEHMAGWYQYSPTPGEVGPSIIDGHLDGVYDTGVFWTLNNIQVNDPIYITRTDGATHMFKVMKVEQVPRDNFPTEEVYGNIDYAGLRLITCGGSFNRAAYEYNMNTVVFAALVN